MQDLFSDLHVVHRSWAWETMKLIPLQHHRSICGLLNHQLLPPSQPGPSGHGWGQKLLLLSRWLWEPVETIGTERTIKSHCLQTQGSVLNIPFSWVSHKSLVWGGQKKKKGVHCFFNHMCLKKTSKELLGMSREDFSTVKGSKWNHFFPLT